jgi:hypothetical protein
MRLDGPQDLSKRFGEEKSLFPLLGVEPRFLCHPTLTLLTTLIELLQSPGRDVNQTWQDTKYLQVASTEVRGRSVLDEGNKEDTKFY